MMWDDPSDKEKDEMITNVAETIYKYDMDLVAILILESIKPLASVGGQLTRFMVAPFIPFIGDKSMPYLATFQNKENVERLIRILEDKGQEDQRKAAEARKKKKQGGGWRRYVPWLTGKEG
jgi:hypothetical protein